MTGQAAGTAAALSVGTNSSVGDLDVKLLVNRLKENKLYLGD